VVAHSFPSGARPPRPDRGAHRWIHETDRVMVDNENPRSGLDRILLIEIGLGLLLFALTVALFLIPAAREPFLPRWWSWPVLASLFFGIVALDHWRRRQGRNAELREVVREVTREAEEDRFGVATDPPPAPAARGGLEGAPEIVIEDESDLAEGDSRREREGLDPRDAAP
jgi:hypothetical protein